MEMTLNHAVDLAEGFVEPEDSTEALDAWQFLVDSGAAWTLQGSFGRQAAALIEAGYINSAEDH